MDRLYMGIEISVKVFSAHVILDNGWKLNYKIYCNRSITYVFYKFNRDQI